MDEVSASGAGEEVSASGAGEAHARIGRIEAGLFLAAVALIFVRSHGVFLHPLAGWEDGTQGLAFYARRDAPPLHRYAGYVSVLPNLVDWLAVRLLPLRAVPYVQAWFALGIAALVVPATYRLLRCVFALPPRAAAALAMAAGAAPVGDFALVSNTEFAIWPMLAVLVLTSCGPVPRRPAALGFYMGWRILFAASNPVCVVVAPVWAALATIHRADRVALAAWLGLTAAEAAYLALGVGGAGHTAQGPASLTATAPASALAPALAIAIATLRLGVEKSLLDVALRSVLRVNGVHPAPWLLAVCAGLAVGGLAWLNQRGRRDRWRAIGEALLLPACAIAIALVCAIGRGAGHGDPTVLDSPRYHAVPTLLWLVALAVGGLRARRQLAGSRAALGHMAAVALLTAMALVWTKGLKAYRAQDASQSRRLERFLAATDAAIARGQAGPFDFPRVGADGDWSLHILP